MNTSLAWLNSYLDRPVDAAEADAILLNAGFPVDGQDDVALTSGGSDVLLDVEVTSNRGDCLSHVGVAREVAANSERSLKGPDVALPESAAGDVNALTSVENAEPELCPLYTARAIKGVKVAPSPQWLVDRLEGAGLRAVNNVVDVTNFVLLELGQPLHAFDMAKLADRRIVVRKATAGEPFTAIDGTKHKLADSMLVIADAAKPVAVAGVMGGLDSEVGDDTVDVLLESAIFQPLSVRATSRRLKLSSDSSYRFERGVDPLGVERASQRAAQLIIDLAGGELAEGVIRVGQDEPAPRQITLRAQRCRDIMGVDVDDEQQAELLSRLGLEVAVADGRINVTVPTFRLDLVREIDLIEEIARLYGLDNIPMREKMDIVARQPQAMIAAEREIARVLIAHGYHETITPSFLTAAQARPFAAGEGSTLTLADPDQKAESSLRPALLPSLLVCRKANQDAGNADVKLFEVASAWAQAEGSKPCERRSLTLLRDAPDGAAAVREIRGVVTALVEALAGAAVAARLEIKSAKASGPWEVAAEVVLDGKLLGTYGTLAGSVADQFDVKTPLAGGDLDAETLVAMYPPTRQAEALPRFPGIERDLSVIVDEAARWEQIASAVEAAKPALLEGVEFITVYRGKQIGAGKKSVSFRMLFRDPSRTLRHEEVDPQVESVVEKLGADLSAALRG